MKKIIIGCLIGLLISSLGFSQSKERKLIHEFPLMQKRHSIFSNPSSHILAYPIKERKTDWLFNGLSGALFTLSMLDLHSTYKIFGYYKALGYPSTSIGDQNPFMNPVIHIKPLSLTIVIGVDSLLVCAFSQTKKRYRTATMIAFSLITLGEACVVYSNYKNANKLEGLIEKLGSKK